MSKNYYGITDQGRQRQNNEDAFIAQPTADGRYLIACAIDGVGGYSGGEIAASIARETILKRLNKISGEVIPALTAAFAAANDKIWEDRQAIKEHNQMACVLTLAVVDIKAKQFYFAHLGDTRLYLFRDGSLVKISHDQSFVGFLEDSGRLSESEAMKHPKRNEIDKALGFRNNYSNSDDIETGQSPFLAGDMLLLCTDGLTDMVNKGRITEILSDDADLNAKGKQLIDAANEAGGRDNITVVLVKNDQAKKEYKASKPAESQPVEKAAAPASPRPQQITRQPAANAPQKTYKGLSIFLLILFIAVAILCVLMYLGKVKSHGDTSQNQPPVPFAPAPRNPQEIKLQQAIDNSKGKLLVLSDTAFKSPVLITHSILINSDSLHIKAKGSIVFKSDDGLKSPAFVLNSGTKNIVLDSVTFQGFNVAVSGHDQALQLKNVRFSDCKISVLNSFIFSTGKYVSGGNTTAPFKTDSLASPHAAKASTAPANPKKRT